MPESQLLKSFLMFTIVTKDTSHFELRDKFNLYANGTVRAFVFYRKGWSFGLASCFISLHFNNYGTKAHIKVTRCRDGKALFEKI